MKRSFSKADSVPSKVAVPHGASELGWFETPRTRWQLRIGLPLIRWRFSGAQRAIYLTFDDGPTPGITDRILDILQAFGAKATFFCLGESVAHGAKQVDRMISMGHTVGNHTFSHLSGWRTSFRDYLADIERCDQLLPKTRDGRLCAFRPPFGQLGILQGIHLIAQRKVVMWDVNSMDYRADQSPKSIANRVCQWVRPGSIVLHHDSPETGHRTMEALPEILENLQSRGFNFQAIR